MLTGAQHTRLTAPYFGPALLSEAKRELSLEVNFDLRLPEDYDAIAPFNIEQQTSRTDLNPIRIEISDCGSNVHLADVHAARSSGFALPHDQTSWPLHESGGKWYWIRVTDPHGSPLASFSLRLSGSRALPGTKLGRVERLGRGIHSSAIRVLGSALAQVSRTIPCLLRLEVSVFDEDNVRREALERSILAAGAYRSSRPRSYSRTIRLDLLDSNERLLASFPSRIQRKLTCFSGDGPHTTALITEVRFLSRLEAIYYSTFARRGQLPPDICFRDVLADARQGTDSVLVGAFTCRTLEPEALVAFGWGRLHGDHVTYDLGGSERPPNLHGVSPGYAVMWHLARWARERSASWLDLGGITPVSQGAYDQLAGISAFKRSLSQVEISVGSEFVFEPNRLFARLATASTEAASWARNFGKQRCR